VPAADSPADRLEHALVDETGLAAVSSLPDFLSTAGELTEADRTLLVDQALVLLDDLYVHLPFKRAMHAIDPIQRLKLLRHRVPQLSERQFHDEMIRIFTGLRDLHTNYVLPTPYQTKTAFLPFLIEEYHEDEAPHYLVSKTFAGLQHRHFKPGVELVYWNGMPIIRAVELNADRQAGSNDDARHARGLEAMTIRPLNLSAPPDEEWVIVGYRDARGDRSIRLEWRVFEPDPSPEGVDPKENRATARALGIDARTEAVRRAKKTLFAPGAMEAERASLAARGDDAPGAPGVDPSTTSTMPDVFSFETVQTPSGSFGHIRIWTFNVQDADAFVHEFIRIASLLPSAGLIVDVRGNGGGLITAGEQLLQVLTPNTIEPERLQFISTPLTLQLVESQDFLADWRSSMEQAEETGTVYSLGFPIDPPEDCNRLGQQYCGPVLLITDALCYSTTDIFSAGFQDHAIGPILGTSGNTGAGGANVWTHDLLRQLFPGRGSPLSKLPAAASFRVAIRRTIRVGDRSGVPVEDLGVVPDEIHRITKADVLEANADLLARAGEILASLPAYALSLVVEEKDGGIEVKATTKRLTRLDAWLDGRPLSTFDVTDGETAITVPAGSAAPRLLELRGFDGGKLAASTRTSV
jgi:Peptidase family S41